MRIKCEACEAHGNNPMSGAYQFRCVACCARLIRSAGPIRRLQEGHIAAMQRFHGRGWSQVWPEIQRLLKEA